MRILSFDAPPIYELPYTSAASGGGVERRSLQLVTATVDALPAGLAALLVTSDLQGVVPSPEHGGALALLGEVLAGDLRGLADGELIPPLDQLGVVLAGDLFAAPAGDRRGATGDVRPVWDAFARASRWVVGVAGNHDQFGSERDRARFLQQSGAHLLDGTVVDLDGLRIGGVSGIVGDTHKHGRRDAATFLDLVARVLAAAPDILLLHEGPDDPATRAKGNADVRALLRDASERLLVICGHSIWPQPLAALDGGGQVVNVAERALLLRPATTR